jgi:hypothetical protein
MICNRRVLAIASAAVVAASTLPAFAASYTKFEEAELAQLDPKVRSEVEARITNGQTVRGVMETMLLNSISAKFQAQRVEAIDWEKSIAVVQMPGGELKSVPFDSKSLTVKA